MIYCFSTWWKYATSIYTNLFFIRILSLNSIYTTRPVFFTKILQNSLDTTRRSFFPLLPYKSFRDYFGLVELDFKHSLGFFRSAAPLFTILENRSRPPSLILWIEKVTTYFATGWGSRKPFFSYCLSGEYSLYQVGAKPDTQFVLLEAEGYIEWDWILVLDKDAAKKLFRAILPV